MEMGNSKPITQQSSARPPYKLETDYPWVGSDSGDIQKFLQKQFLTTELDELTPWLWLVSTPDSSHISSLHYQLVRGREIVITEECRLHLLWYRDKIFIKPLPPYSLQPSFKFEMEGAKIKQAVNGFHRSYGYLIQSPSDLEIAIDHKLLPRTWIEQYQERDQESDREKKSGSDEAKAKLFSFLRNYRDLKDDQVSPRYRYGELRLHRVNFYNRVFRHRLYYQKVHSDYASFFHRFTQPFLFVFGTISVILGAFQVAIAAKDNTPTLPTWKNIPQIANIFSLGCIALVAVSACVLFLLLVLLVVREALFSIKKLGERRNSR